MNIKPTDTISKTDDIKNSQSTTEQTETTEEGQTFQDLINAGVVMPQQVLPSQLGDIVSVYDISDKIDGIEKAGGIFSVPKSSFNYDTLTISKEDALFFVDMIDNTVETNFTPATPQSFIQTVSNVDEVQKTAEVSKTLLNLIENAYTTSKPCRIDFDNNISVILKVDKEGKITAHFIPSDEVALQYLRNNIGYLRNSFDNQNIEYNELTYRDSQGNGKNKKNQQQGDKNE